MNSFEVGSYKAAEMYLQTAIDIKTDCLKMLAEYDIDTVAHVLASDIERLKEMQASNEYERDAKLDNLTGGNDD